MKPKNEIDQVDANVGEHLRFARSLRGMSQETLARLEGVTFQQIQKYETGANRISASRLAHLAGFLQFPIGWFFEKMLDARVNERGFTGRDSIPDGEGAGMENIETKNLICAYYGIKDRESRFAIYGLIKLLELGGSLILDS